MPDPTKPEPERASLRAAALIWIVGSVASWVLVYWIYRLVRWAW